MNRQRHAAGRDTVLITGASKGIGRAFAQRFAREGYPLVLVARQQDVLEELASNLRAGFGVSVEVLPLDLTAPDSISRLLQTLAERQLDIDILVNNAGALEVGRFTDIAAEKHGQLIALNVGSPTQLASALLPAMLRRKRGHILNVASIAAFEPVPSIAVYAATKAYVLSFTEALSEELRGTGVSVSALCPGLTSTPMVRGAQAGSQRLRHIPELVIGQADDVAQAGFRSCFSGRVVSIPGLLNKLTAAFVGIAPRAVVRRISGWLGRLAFDPT